MVIDGDKQHFPAGAEEVKRPERDLPIGLIGTLAICTIMYIIVTAIMTGIVPYAKFLGMTTVILVMAYGQTRILFAMSRDGLLPHKLSEIHPRFGTPFFATWIVGIIFGLLSAVVPLGVLGELVNMGTLAVFCAGSARTCIALSAARACLTFPRSQFYFAPC